MSSLSFDKNDPQTWLKETRKLFQLWMYKADVAGGIIKFNEQIIFEIPKTKKEKEFVVIPIQTKITYVTEDLNHIYMMISSAVRNYIKS